MVNDCKINLTKKFVHQRLAIYKNRNNPQTQQFISLYRNQHLIIIIKWLKKI